MEKYSAIAAIPLRPGDQSATCNPPESFCLKLTRSAVRPDFSGAPNIAEFLQKAIDMTPAAEARVSIMQHIDRQLRR